MNDLQGAGSIDQGSNGAQFQNTGSGLQQTQNIQGSGSQQNVLGISSVLTQTNPSAEVKVDTTSSGTTSSSVPTTLTSSGFAVSPWLIIAAGAVVIFAGISFIWSQRHDMQRI